MIGKGKNKTNLRVKIQVVWAHLAPNAFEHDFWLFPGGRERERDKGEAHVLFLLLVLFVVITSRFASLFVFHVTTVEVVVFAKGQFCQTWTRSSD